MDSTTKPQHTPEPWRVAPTERDANAARIVACVNHCAGMTNEELEASRAVENRARAADAYDRLSYYEETFPNPGALREVVKAIDELLVNLYDANAHPVLRSALAKLEGGAS